MVRFGCDENSNFPQYNFEFKSYVKFQMKVLIVNQVNVFKDIKIYKEKNNKEILVKLYFSDIRFNRTIQNK